MHEHEEMGSSTPGNSVASEYTQSFGTQSPMMIRVPTHWNVACMGTAEWGGSSIRLTVAACEDWCGGMERALNDASVPPRVACAPIVIMQ